MNNELNEMQEFLREPTKINRAEAVQAYLGMTPEEMRELKRETLQTQNVDLDRYDTRVFGELLKESPELTKLAESRGEAWQALLNDLWGLYYKVAPELLEEEKVARGFKENRGFLEKALEDPAVAEARLTTMLDEVSSAIATQATGEALLKEITNNPDLKAAMEAVEKSVQHDAEGNSKASDKQSAWAKAMMEKNARAMRMAVRAAAEKGKEEANKTAEAMVGWGLEPGQGNAQAPIGERLKLAKRINTVQMRRIAELVGRFRNLARARQKQKVKKRTDEIHTIGLGNDLGRVLPAELAMLDDPLRELDFSRRYVERQLLQYDLRGREAKKRGPIIACVDESGSMSGQPMEWATAVALALADTATRQKRQAAVIYFDTRVTDMIEFKPGERDLEKMLQLATKAANGGGTAFEPPLERAVKMIEDGGGYKDADIFFITDGISAVSADFLKKYTADKKRLQFRTWSVVIGYDSGGVLKTFSDRSWAVRNLDEETAGEIFEEVW